ncbi:MAG: radical SAM protein, partial [candidate division KSB1 bacterium]|nr:radical SAM protein [candidate division KSB1 bacterium]
MYPFKELYTPTLSPVDVVLIYPPVSKPSEPPAGVARLKGALQAHGISSRIIDANLGGLEFLLSESFEPQNAAEAVALHRRYLNRRLIAVARRKNAFISLTDFALTGLSPHKSDDLLAAAEKPQLSPFYDYYAAELIPTIDHLAPKLIGVSIVYLSQALPAFALLGLLRRHFSGVKLVIGGGLVTSW